MKQFPDRFGFYAILTSPKRGYDYLTEVLVEHEVGVVQLREKHLPAIDILRIAERMRKITEGSSTLFVVNDSPQIAVDAGADGVHLGQDDMTPLEVRALVGEKLFIGLSTHNPQQTKDALIQPVQYVGVGPVYPTPTKDIPDPVLGLATMQEMVEIATVPAVCLGGISLELLSGVLQAGAHNFSLVRPLCDAENPREVVKMIQKIYTNR